MIYVLTRFLMKYPGSLKTHTPVGKSDLKDNLHKQLWMGTKIALTIPPPQGVRKYDGKFDLTLGRGRTRDSKQ